MHTVPFLDYKWSGPHKNPPEKFQHIKLGLTNTASPSSHKPSVSTGQNLPNQGGIAENFISY